MSPDPRAQAPRGARHNVVLPKPEGRGKQSDRGAGTKRALRATAALWATARYVELRYSAIHPAAPARLRRARCPLQPASQYCAKRLALTSQRWHADPRPEQRSPERRGAATARGLPACLASSRAHQGASRVTRAGQVGIATRVPGASRSRSAARVSASACNAGHASSSSSLAKASRRASAARSICGPGVASSWTCSRSCTALRCNRLGCVALCTAISLSIETWV